MSKRITHPSFRQVLQDVVIMVFGEPHVVGRTDDCQSWAQITQDFRVDGSLEVLELVPRHVKVVLDRIAVQQRAHNIHCVVFNALGNTPGSAAWQEVKN